MRKSDFTKIEELICQDLGGRGLGKAALIPGDLARAAEKLMDSTTVLIVTGFGIKDTLIGETDGPLGALSLAGALEELGKNAVLITDQYSSPLLEAGSTLKGLSSPLEVVPYDGAEIFCVDLINKYRPSMIVAIERPGRARDGRFYSMRGEDLTYLIPNTDPLFTKAAELGIPTAAVGDGGNELGMGKIADIIQNSVSNGTQICAVTRADYVLVTGVSNWGGHGLTAALSLLSGKNLLHDRKMEKDLLAALVKEGAIDGCSKKREMTVDGLSLEINLAILDELHQIVEMELLKEKKAVSF
ncbi:MAG: DUF4392 domain-containing protein [Bacillota bacterium]|uniref:DUF4392 domain-containing protein n=1 Tax=Thermanaerosceptrum fracticalcis TaxID=1712410 RepID=UPI00068EF87E|nr:DUF4392 domain-containing protein [Thermanaerosceptrum fracticalcis]